MTLPRSVLIDPSCTPYYQCVSRCVRRAFLCGKDSVTGRDFEHRRAWLEARLLEMADVFAIDLCAYAVMSNHYHVVLHINTAQQQGWTDADVLAHYRRIHRIPAWFETADEQRIRKTIKLWRERLGSISWFMKCVNEPLARLANREDGCKGRFWEGRFKSQALLDDESVLKCMVYVDLNPIRAQLVQSLAQSDYTSIQARIEHRDQNLAPFAASRARKNRAPWAFSLPIKRQDYLCLVDYTGRQLRPGKHGRIPETVPPIVAWLSKGCRRHWLEEMSQLTSHYSRAIGNLLSLCAYRDHLGQTKLRGLRS